MITFFICKHAPFKMMFFTAASALALSDFGMASSIVNGAGESDVAVNASGMTNNTMSAYTLQRLLEKVEPGEADWGGHFRSRDTATLVAMRRKCTGRILKLSDTRRRPLAVSERTSKSNLYDNNTRKCQDNGLLSMAHSLSI
jgi:hypothetical protein